MLHTILLEQDTYLPNGNSPIQEYLIAFNYSYKEER